MRGSFTAKSESTAFCPVANLADELLSEIARIKFNEPTTRWVCVIAEALRGKRSGYFPQ
jgi:hypothetical protein